MTFTARLGILAQPLPDNLQAVEAGAAREQDGADLRGETTNAVSTAAGRCGALRAVKAKLQAMHALLDPFALKKSLEQKLRQFFPVLGNLDRESTPT